MNTDYIGDYVSALELDPHYTEVTARDRRRCLKALEAWLIHTTGCGLERATTKSLREWLANPSWAPNTKKAYTNHVIGAYRWWTTEGYMDGNPAAKIRPPDVPKGKARPMPDEYLAILLAEQWPLPTIAYLGAYEGLRRAEMCGLYREDITRESTFIRRAKGGLPDTVPTHPLVWEHIQSLPAGPAELVDDEVLHPLLYGAYRRQLTPNGLSKLWIETRARLGIPRHIVPHMLRHYCGTEVRRATHDIYVTAKVLRHKSAANAEIYSDVSDQERREALFAMRTVAPASGLAGTSRRQSGSSPSPASQAA